MSIREQLKHFPVLVKTKRAIQRMVKIILIRTIHRRSVDIIKKLPIFTPASSGSYKKRAALTILGANQIFPLLADFVSSLDAVEKKGGVFSKLNIDAEEFCIGENSRKSADDLKYLFNKYGSDKSNRHNYHYIYGRILREKNAVSAILEFGLGTNNRDMVSNMGSAGKPGASLYAFRDFLPNAKIYGADIDKRILFKEKRIETFFADQTDLKSFNELNQTLGENSLDLIVDDGLHAPNANIAVLLFGLKKLKHGGWLVIEDIEPRALPLWQVVAYLLPDGYNPHLINATQSLVFAVEHLLGNQRPLECLSE